METKIIPSFYRHVIMISEDGSTLWTETGKRIPILETQFGNLVWLMRGSIPHFYRIEDVVEFTFGSGDLHPFIPPLGETGAYLYNPKTKLLTKCKIKGQQGNILGVSKQKGCLQFRVKGCYNV